MRIFIFFLLVTMCLILYSHNYIENFFNYKKYSISRYFDKVYVIVLDERKKYIANIMSKYNINPIYVDAILKSSINKQKLISDNVLSPNNYRETDGNPLLYSQIACHQSHCKVLSNFLSSNAKNCLIFEDDISEPKYDLKFIDNVLANLYKSLPDNYDIVYFGKCYEFCDKVININKYLGKCYRPYCRHAYSVSRKGAEKILKMTIPMKMAGDQMIAKLIRENKLNAYSSIPTLFYQNRNDLISTLNNGDDARECMGVPWSFGRESPQKAVRLGF